MFPLLPLEPHFDVPPDPDDPFACIQRFLMMFILYHLIQHLMILMFHLLATDQHYLMFLHFRRSEILRFR
jgi:hypothetical protein